MIEAEGESDLSLQLLWLVLVCSRRRGFQFYNTVFTARGQRGGLFSVNVCGCGGGGGVRVEHIGLAVTSGLHCVGDALFPPRKWP